MEPRIEAELELLRKAYPNAVYKDGWVMIADYPLPPGWSVAVTDVAFFIRPGYPGTHPYGIFVSEGLTHSGQPPNNYTCPSDPQPPFAGRWGMFSWQPDDGVWSPAAEPAKGHNLLTWVAGFKKRFLEGR